MCVLLDHERNHGSCQVLPYHGRLCEASSGPCSILWGPDQHSYQGQPFKQGDESTCPGSAALLVLVSLSLMCALCVGACDGCPRADPGS
jgi:hypothetical protein